MIGVYFRSAERRKTVNSDFNFLDHIICWLELPGNTYCKSQTWFSSTCNALCIIGSQIQNIVGNVTVLGLSSLFWGKVWSIIFTDRIKNLERFVRFNPANLAAIAFLQRIYCFTVAGVHQFAVKREEKYSDVWRRSRVRSVYQRFHPKPIIT